MSTTPPLISVVVPVYNGAKYIPNCLASVKRAVDGLSPEDRGQIEVILCDNHSTDETVALAEQHKPDCTYRVIQPPKFYENRCLNWHHGLASAKGVWMMMLHADDMLSDGGLAALLYVIRRPVPKSVVLIQGRHREFRNDTDTPSDLKPKWPMAGVFSGNALRLGALSFFCPFVPFLLMRRETYNKVGGLNKDYELIQDWDLWIRILGQGDLFFLPDEVGRWRLHDTSEKYQRIFMREHLDLAYRIPKLIPGLSPEAAAYTVTYQRARVRSCFPDESLDSFLAGLPTKTVPLSPEQIKASQDDYKTVLKAGLKKVTNELNKVRIAGLFRLPAAR